MGTAAFPPASLHLCASAIAICLLLQSALASPRSSQLIDEGTAHLEAGRLDEASKSFEEAIKADPDDPEAAFFAGVALNRLGRSAEALARLATARRLGSDHPDLPFEMGWGLLSLRRWEEAIQNLTRYEAQNPGRGQTSEFLGRAYLALGRYKEAEAAFDVALQRDPDLLPTVTIYRALLRQRQGDESAARDELSGLFRAAPNSPITQLIGTQLQPVGVHPFADRNWRLSIGAAIGYNSNARGFNVITPDNPNDPIPAHNSGFTRHTLSAGYAIINHPTDRLTLGYDLLADFYFRQETDPDVLDQNIYLEYWRALGDRFTTTLRIWDNHTFVGEEEFRNEAAAQGSLATRIGPTLFVEGSYRYAFDDYLLPLLDTEEVFNRDAQAHTLTLAAELAIPQVNSRLRGGYFHLWNFATGDDFDYQSDGLFVGVQCSLPWTITAEGFYVHTWDRYADPNSAGPRPVPPPDPLPPRDKRRDDIDGLSFRLSRPISRQLNVYIEYNYNRDDSNIPGYDYQQHITSAGLIWQF